MAYTLISSRCAKGMTTFSLGRSSSTNGGRDWSAIAVVWTKSFDNATMPFASLGSIGPVLVRIVTKSTSWLMLMSSYCFYSIDLIRSAKMWWLLGDLAQRLRGNSTLLMFVQFSTKGSYTTTENEFGVKVFVGVQPP